jgi:hypothetical protein
MRCCEAAACCELNDEESAEEDEEECSEYLRILERWKTRRERRRCRAGRCGGGDGDGERDRCAVDYGYAGGGGASGHEGHTGTCEGEWEMVQAALGASGPAQVFELMEKSAALSPLRVTVESCKVDEPELVAMMD